MSRVRGNAGGFTLLEALLALVLLALMFAVLMPTLTTGARSWSAAEERLQDASGRSQAATVIEQLLAQARPLPMTEASENDGLAFAGGPDGVLLVGSLPAYRGGGGLQVLRLYAGSHEGRAGLVVDWQDYHPQVPMAGPEEGERGREMILPGVRQVELGYLGQPAGESEVAWYSNWQEQQALPRLIRMRMRLADGDTLDIAAAPLLSSAESAGIEGPGRQ